MAVARSRIALLMAAAVVLLMAAAPALCVELRLAGASVGDTPEELLASPSFGPPDGLFSPGNVFNSVKAAPGEIPPWAVAVQMEQVVPGQVEWVYNRDPVSVGILITGQGINAHVSDIAVSLWRNFGPSKVAQTAKGVFLGTSFADLLARYGWPNRIQIIAEAERTQQAAAGQPAAGTLGGLRPGGALRFGFGARRAGTAAPAATPAAPVGAFGLSFGFGGRGRTTAPAGVQPLPSVGPGMPVRGAAAPGAAGAANNAVADVGQTPNVTFTKSCVISYPSVDFVIYRMKVFRIHVYGR